MGYDPFASDYILEVLTTTKSKPYSYFTLPFGPIDPSQVNSTGGSPYVKFQAFGPRYDAIQAGETADLFCKGWEIRSTEGLAATQLYAMTYGTVTYDTIIVNGNPVSRLILFIPDFLNICYIKKQNWLPSWFPFVSYIIYENVDEAEVRTQIAELLVSGSKSKSSVLELIREEIQDPSYNGSESDLVEAFISGNVPGVNKALSSKLSILVYTGAAIGRMAGSDITGERKCAIQFVDEVSTPEDTYYLNPSYYLYLIDQAGKFTYDLTEHPFETALLDSTEIISSKGRLRFVQKSGTDLPEGIPNAYLTLATAAKNEN